MTRTWIRRVVAVALAALLVTSCAQDTASPEADPAEASTSDSDDNGGDDGENSNGGDDGNGGGSSDSDGPGPDDPVDEPTLSLPGLPIGGRTYLSIDGTHPDNQCANVNWIVDSSAADLAAEIEVEVTGFDFDPDVFTVASAGCDDDAPSCPGFVFTVDAQVCNLAVAPIPGSDTRLDSYTFALVGRVDCREIGSDRCEAFKDAVAAEPSLSLRLDPPFTGTGEDDSDETDGDGTDEGPDGGAESDPESGADTDSESGSGTGTDPDAGE